MINVILSAETTEGAVKQMQSYFGGEISERWGEYTLAFDNDTAKGCVRCISFDWGVSLLEIDAIFFEDVLFVSDNGSSNPIHFTYCSQGCYRTRFENETQFQTVEQFHSSIIVSKTGLKLYSFLPKDIHIILNNIRIVRKEFLKKRNNQLSELNENLYRVFVDDKDEKEFAYYGPIHLKMEDYVKTLRDLKTEGMTRVLHIEGEVYHLLSMHIARHDKYQNNDVIPSTLLKDELKIIRRHAKKILDDPSLNYNLDQISKDSGLSQAKLQEGFKFLYARTVTEYIRHVRLEAARDLMNTTDLNISQIVYTIGFTSRSYFSKIFKEKYEMTPHEFRKQVVMVNVEETE
ncbi:helix-turn-helix transcriptional regulator [Gelidibacter mesophilus]|uniref:helix-turn-helix transcriptional regulator n=1 Tax=Gelidibacter mesophilus TaxID=169050 RepID=UPI000417EADE|nr:helix-turn-helix transcriptional regulator [Gelidibacter mesophilus]